MQGGRHTFVPRLPVKEEKATATHWPRGRATFWPCLWSILAFLSCVVVMCVHAVSKLAEDAAPPFSSPSPPALFAAHPKNPRHHPGHSNTAEHDAPTAFSAHPLTLSSSASLPFPTHSPLPRLADPSPNRHILPSEKNNHGQRQQWWCSQQPCKGPSPCRHRPPPPRPRRRPAAARRQTAAATIITNAS